MCKKRRKFICSSEPFCVIPKFEIAGFARTTIHHDSEDSMISPQIGREVVRVSESDLVGYRLFSSWCPPMENGNPKHQKHTKRGNFVVFFCSKKNFSDLL